MHIRNFFTKYMKKSKKIWISLYCLRTVSYGTVVVIEIKLCKSSVEVWFVEVRLVVYDDVEVLDGEEIVVVKQCIASNIRHPVSVDLSIADRDEE